MLSEVQSPISIIHASIPYVSMKLKLQVTICVFVLVKKNLNKWTLTTTLISQTRKMNLTCL